MALVKIDSPSDAPVAIADWYKINAVLQTIGNGMGSGSRVIGTNFQRGSVLFIAGSWYIADSDTAITGTESRYVKVTNTAGVLSLSFVANITGVSWNKQYQGYYDANGNMYLFDEVKAYGDGVIDTLYTVINTRISQEFSKIIANISTNYKRLLRPVNKTILTLGSGTYTVPDGVYSLEVFMQGPGENGKKGSGYNIGSGGASGQSKHYVMEATPGQTITWTISETTTTFGIYALSTGGGFIAESGNGAGEGGGVRGVRNPVANSGGGGAGGDQYAIIPQIGATGRIEIW